VSGANNELKVIVVATLIKSALYTNNVLIIAKQHCLFIAPGCVADWKDTGVVFIVKLEAINDI